MRTYAESTVFSTVPNADGSPVIVEVASRSNPDKKYRVDLTNGRCSCPGWIFQRGHRSPCQHLKDLGYYDVQQVNAIAEPQKAKTQTVKEPVTVVYESEVPPPTQKLKAHT